MNRETLIKKGYELLDIQSAKELISGLQEWKREIANSIDELSLDCVEQCRQQLVIVDIQIFSEDKKVGEYQRKVQAVIDILKFYNKEGCNEDTLNTFLENFDMFLQYLFYTAPMNKATLNFDLLQEVVIKNEYDLQHIMFAAIKAMYPDARREVCQDTGYSNVRYDILIDKIDTVIELKCTREDHSDKKLLAELGEDAYFYQCSNLLMYVYDRNQVIKDIVNFKKALEEPAQKMNKKVNVFICQK